MQEPVDKRPEIKPSPRPGKQDTPEWELPEREPMEPMEQKRPRMHEHTPDQWDAYAAEMSQSKDADPNALYCRVPEHSKLEEEMVALNDKMMTKRAVDESIFGPVQPNVDTITLLRIYDVLMTLLSLSNANEAVKLMKVHAAGGLVTPAPAYDPEFIEKLGNVPDAMKEDIKEAILRDLE